MTVIAYKNFNVSIKINVNNMRMKDNLVNQILINIGLILSIKCLDYLGNY